MNVFILVAGLGVVALIAEIAKLRFVVMPIVLVGLLAGLGVNLLDWNNGGNYFGSMMILNNQSVAFNEILIAIALGWFLLSPSFFSDENHATDYYSIVLFALSGGLLLTSFGHLSMLFLGIEILSISMYVMAGSRKTDLRSNEAAMKYFLMGAFATGFLLMGITLIYGASGTFELEQIRQYSIAYNGHLPIIFHVGVLLILVGLVFKISAVPFHFWAPDVYEGSPVVITAFMATIVKVAALAGFFRLFYFSFTVVQGIWVPILVIISGLTILVGNLSALFQKDLKRMLAFSSISHAGYLLFAILAMNNLSAPSLMFYSIAYSFATLAAFVVVLVMFERSGKTDIESLKGLFQKNPFLAFALTVSMLSLAGIPPLAGFFAKYYLFAAAIKGNFAPLVILALLGSLIGVYYYFRVIFTLFQEADGSEPYPVTLSHKVLLTVALAITIVLGALPNLLLNLW